MASPTSTHDSVAPNEHDSWDPYEDAVDEPSQPLQTSQLIFCQLLDWDDTRIYDDTYMRYTIEWKLTVNNRAVVPKDTVQDIVLAPGAYWQKFLEPKLEDTVRKLKRSLDSNFTSIVISVTQRKQADIPKRFDNKSVDWVSIESQFVAWSEFYRAGKQFKLKISFDFIEKPNAGLRRGDKRGIASTTRQMLAAGNLQLDAEQHSSGGSSVWRHVYMIMRCTGPPCNKGPYCWCDPIGKKHYKLHTDTMKNLVEFVEDGNTLETHDDVPEDIREQLYAEDRQAHERRQKTLKPSTGNLSALPINITMLPAPAVSVPASETVAVVEAIHHLDIPGYLDDQVEEYCAWQQSRVRKAHLKAEYQKACDIMIGDGLTLGLIKRDPDPKLLTDQGVKRGPAEHVVGDIDFWLKNVKRVSTVGFEIGFTPALFDFLHFRLHLED